MRRHSNAIECAFGPVIGFEVSFAHIHAEKDNLNLNAAHSVNGFCHENLFLLFVSFFFHESLSEGRRSHSIQINGFEYSVILYLFDQYVLTY